MDGQRIGLDETQNPPNTIFYRRWDGQAWAEPLDIIAVSGDPVADFVAAAVDSEDRLHLVWTGLTQLYYSTVPLAEAYSVRAWSTPQIIAPDSARSRFESDVAVDAQGIVHVVYAAGGNAPGVFHIMLLPDSTFWTMPVRISNYLRDNEVAFRDVRVAIDSSDRLHVVWSTANMNGYGQAVYYTHCESSEQVWPEPILMADATTGTGFIGFPSLLSYGRDDLLLIYIGEEHRGRIQRISVDAGKTWSEPRPILPSMEGVNGFLVPLLDGGGGLHLVIDMRPSVDQRVGIYYAPWAGFDWSPVMPVAVDAPYGPSAHYTDAVIRLGNEIHIVWTQLHGGEIWHVKGTIKGLDPIPAQALPAVATPSQATDVSTFALAQPPLTPVGIPKTPSDTWKAPSSQVTAQWIPVVMAVIPVLLFVVGIVIWEIRKK